MEIAPIGVGVFNELEFSDAPPTFQRPFPGLRGLGVGKDSEIHQPFDTMALGKSVCSAFLMLSNAACEIGRHADAKRSIWLVCENIDECGSLHLFAMRRLDPEFRSPDAKRSGRQCFPCYLAY